jgi:hypothetical protein
MIVHYGYMMMFINIYVNIPQCAGAHDCEKERSICPQPAPVSAKQAKSARKNSPVHAQTEKLPAPD